VGSCHASKSRSTVPKAAGNALLAASEYLGWYLTTHVALGGPYGTSKTRRVVICLAEAIGKRGLDGFEFDATNEELPGAANVTPFTASRILGEWQNNCAVVKHRGKILLRSPERLFLHSV